MGTKVTFEALQSGMAEAALHGATNLRRETDPVLLIGRDQHRFDLAAIMQLKQKLHRPIIGLLEGVDLGEFKTQMLGDKLLRGLGEIHRAGIKLALLVVPAKQQRSARDREPLRRKQLF